MKKVKVGLLPLYVKLYDEFLPWMRPRIEAFHREITDKLSDCGLDVMTVAPCRLENEFRAAIREFEENGAEALITLHLAYSPSLQSEKPLKECRRPIIILDTTQDYEFSPEAVLPGELSGIYAESYPSCRRRAELGQDGQDDDEESKLFHTKCVNVEVNRVQSW